MLQAFFKENEEHNIALLSFWKTSVASGSLFLSACDPLDNKSGGVRQCMTGDFGANTMGNSLAPGARKQPTTTT